MKRTEEKDIAPTSKVTLSQKESRTTAICPHNSVPPSSYLLAYWKAHIAPWLRKNQSSLYGFLCLFLSLNILFLYHGAHFLFGDHDWKYLREPIALSAGLFEARFSQFIPINLFTQGEILPILNNVIGFFFFSLGIVILGKYWHLPQKKRIIIPFCLLLGLSPYILSFMYFAFLIIPVLSWNFVVISALILSSRPFKIRNSLSAVVLFTLALGGYPPVINLVAVAVMVRLLLEYLEHPQSLPQIITAYRLTVINFLVSLGCYKLILIYFTKIGAINNSYYNLQTLSLTDILPKLLQTGRMAYEQFFMTLPFITAEYKHLMFILLLLAGGIVLYRLKQTQKWGGIIIFLGCILAPLAVFFISTATAETEFSPRIDFFGLLYLYGGLYAVCQSTRLSRNLSFVCAGLSILVSINAVTEAQKVWKLGFENELKLYQRIGKRFQEDELFNPYSRYIIVQDQDTSFLRNRYYHTPYRHKSDDLLNIAYVPGLNAGWMWDFYSGTDYADKTAYVYTFRPDTTALETLKQAQPWPKPNSVAVGSYWIMYFLNPTSLENLKQKYH